MTLAAERTFTELGERELERWHVTGLEVVVVSGSDVLFEGGLGVRDAERGLPVTPLTAFHHGSTGKAFTALLTAVLVDEGKLAWDEPIRTYLPEFRLSDPVATERITIADLLSHRSGLARHEWMWLANPSWTRAEILRRLRYREMSADIRTTLQYCNLGYTTVGHVIETVAGSSWHNELRSRVLDPLEMTNTFSSIEAAKALDDHAVPHASGKPIEFRPTDTIAPAGGVFSCAVDTAKWLLYQLGDGRPLLSEAAFQATHTIHTALATPTEDPEINYFGYGLGWIVGSYRGRRLIWHNGGIDGFYTEMVMIPSERIGVAACTNGGHTSHLPTAVAYTAVDLLLGEEPKPWSDVLFERRNVQQTSRDIPAVTATRPSHDLREYAGTYEHPGYGALEVSAQDGALAVSLGDLPFDTTRRNDDTWSLRYEPLDDGWPVSFVTDPDGRIATAVVPFDGIVAPISFAQRADA